MIDHRKSFGPPLKYRLVDFFAVVPRSLSGVNYKCINGRTQASLLAIHHCHLDHDASFFSASLKKNAEALFSIFPWVLHLSQGKSKTRVNQFFLLNHYSYFFYYYSYFFDGGGGGVKQGALFGNSSYTIYCTRLQVK